MTAWMRDAAATAGFLVFIISAFGLANFAHIALA